MTSKAYLLPILLMLLCPAPASAGELAPVDRAEIAPLASRSLLLGGVAVGDLLAAVGERGHILLSRDGGMSWDQSEVPTRATLTGLFFQDRNLGWAVGHDGVILRTLDGGESWQLVHHAPEVERPLLDLYFLDANRGFAVGAYGYFLETSDGGDSWRSRSIAADDYHLNRIGISEKGTLYIAAEAGTIYRSDDGGKNWRELPSPYEGSFFGVLPLEGETLLLFGLRGHLFRSEDGGTSWRRLESSTDAMLTDALLLTDDMVVVTGHDGTVLVSDDGGRSFNLRQQAGRMGIAAIVEAVDGSLIAIGEGGIKKIAIGRQPDR